MVLDWSCGVDRSERPTPMQVLLGGVYDSTVFAAVEDRAGTRLGGCRCFLDYFFLDCFFVIWTVEARVSVFVLSQDISSYSRGSILIARTKPVMNCIFLSFGIALNM